MPRIPRILTPLLLLVFLCSCSRSPTVPDNDSSQKLPFDREPSTRGAAPTERLVPSARIPEGTSLTVRLTGPISSASAHAEESFQAWLDDPVVADGQTLLPRGAAVKGRILDAKASPNADDPGYLRIALVSIDVQGNSVPIVSSSVFAKAAAHPETSPQHLPEHSPDLSRDHSSENSSDHSPDHSSSIANSARAPNDVIVAADRRLTFRLVRSLDLP